MKFTEKLVKGKLIKRYKRFFVDVKLDKETITAHCPNTGSMMDFLMKITMCLFLKTIIQKEN